MLNGKLIDALEEVSRYRAPFWWRQASMRKLAALGLVEAWHPEGKATKNPAHRITAKGREFLSGFPRQSSQNIEQGTMP